jgi:DNA-binding MarR family transcriptional regulator
MPVETFPNKKAFARRLRCAFCNFSGSAELKWASLLGGFCIESSGLLLSPFPLSYLCNVAILQRHMPPSPSSAKTKSASRPLTVSRSELLVNGSDAEFRAVVHRMLAFAAQLDRIRGGFAALVGLTGIQYTILISISHLEADGGVTVGAVADHLHLSGAFITLETGKLARLGLITKVQDFSDRRRVCLRVTGRARELLCELTRVQAPVNDALFDFLTGAQFRAVAAMVRRAVACGDRALALLDYLATHSPGPKTDQGTATLEAKEALGTRR